MTRQAIEVNSEPSATEGKVGYKRPPVKSQFRKGQSGNPRGRRKGQRNLPAVLAEVLHQTVTVKQEGKAQRMSKGEALIKMLLNKAHSGERRAIMAVLELSEKIGRIEIPDLKLGGRGSYEFMLVPGVAASAEEWQREIDGRHEMAALREAIADFRTRTGAIPTESQIDALRESIAASHASGTSPTITPPTVTRRPVNRINKSTLKPDPTLEQPKGEAAPQMPATPPRVQRSPTGTYRKVNRRPPDSPNEVSDA